MLSGTLSGQNTYTVNYNFAMSTSSLNASLGIFGIDYRQNKKRHGFRMNIVSLNSSAMQVFLRVNNNQDPLYTLKISFLVSYSPLIDIHYA